MNFIIVVELLLIFPGKTVEDLGFFLLLLVIGLHHHTLSCIEWNVQAQAAHLAVDDLCLISAGGCHMKLMGTRLTWWCVETFIPSIKDFLEIWI